MAFDYATLLTSMFFKKKLTKLFYVYLTGILSTDLSATDFSPDLQQQMEVIGQPSHISRLSSRFDFDNNQNRREMVYESNSPNSLIPIIPVC